MTMNRIRAAARVLPFLLLSGAAYAQAAPPPTGAPPAVTSTEALAPVPKEKLDQMLAPIALYPDELVTNVLMASTYPDQLAEAARWMKEPNNAALKGDALADALRPQQWDPSVKFLIPFPQVMQQLNDHADWRQDLGNAFTVQQADVMSEVQHLRGMALSCGKLQSTPQQIVTHERSVIAIAPRDPGVVYVPVYNPTVAYGVWPYPAYAPRYYAWPSAFLLGGVGFGIDVGIGYSVGFGAVGPYWGWSRPDWGRGVVNVDFRRVNRIGNFDRAAMNSRFSGGRWHNGAELNRHGRAAALRTSSAAESRRHVASRSAHGRHTASSREGRGEEHAGGGKHNVGHRDNGWHGNHNEGGKHGGGDHGGGGGHGNGGHNDGGGHGGGGHEGGGGHGGKSH
jgi:hypothetical protein